MVCPPKPQGKAQDLRAVCSMMWGLLGLGKAEGTGGTTRLLASDFAGAPSSATIEELLQVYPKISSQYSRELTLSAESTLSSD